jgi:hypothetical protein
MSQRKERSTIPIYDDDCRLIVNWRSPVTNNSPEANMFNNYARKQHQLIKLMSLWPEDAPERDEFKKKLKLVREALLYIGSSNS